MIINDEIIKMIAPECFDKALTGDEEAREQIREWIEDGIVVLDENEVAKYLLENVQYTLKDDRSAVKSDDRVEASQENNSPFRDSVTDYREAIRRFEAYYASQSEYDRTIGISYLLLAKELAREQLEKGRIQAEKDLAGICLRLGRIYELEYQDDAKAFSMYTDARELDKSLCGDDFMRFLDCNRGKTLDTEAGRIVLDDVYYKSAEHDFAVACGAQIRYRAAVRRIWSNMPVDAENWFRYALSSDDIAVYPDIRKNAETILNILSGEGLSAEVIIAAVRDRADEIIFTLIKYQPEQIESVFAACSNDNQTSMMSVLSLLRAISQEDINRWTGELQGAFFRFMEQSLESYFRDGGTDIVERLRQYYDADHRSDKLYETAYYISRYESVLNGPDDIARNYCLEAAKHGVVDAKKFLWDLCEEILREAHSKQGSQDTDKEEIAPYLKYSKEYYKDQYYRGDRSAESSLLKICLICQDYDEVEIIYKNKFEKGDFSCASMYAMVVARQSWRKEESFNIYLAGAKHGMEDCYRKVADYLKNAGNTSSAIWYEKAANCGDVYAMEMTGDSYRIGSGVGKNLNKALHYYGSAIDKGSKTAYRGLAYAFKELNDIGSFVRYIRVAPSLTNTCIEMIDLGKILIDERYEYLKKYDREGIDLLEKAASMGDLSASFYAGEYYMKMSPPDFDRAEKHLRKLWEDNSSEKHKAFLGRVSFYLGRIYEHHGDYVNTKKVYNERMKYNDGNYYGDLLHIGITYLNHEEWDCAKDIFLKIYKEDSKRMGVAAVMYAASCVGSDRDKKQADAKEWLKKAMVYEHSDAIISNIKSTTKTLIKRGEIDLEDEGILDYCIKHSADDNESSFFTNIKNSIKREEYLTSIRNLTRSFKPVDATREDVRIFEQFADRMIQLGVDPDNGDLVAFKKMIKQCKKMLDYKEKGADVINAGRRRGRQFFENISKRFDPSEHDKDQ